MQRPREQSRFALFGAILLSAVGSLPLHLLSLTIVSLIVDGRVPIAAAGWVASAILVGQLMSSLTLPFLKISIVSRPLALAATLLLLTGLTTTALNNSASLYLGWWLVGISCGVLMYLGTASAAHYGRTTFAFSLRLGVVLILAGSVASGLLIGNALTSYHSFLTVLFLTFGLISVVGLVLYSPIALDIKTATQGQERRWHTPQITGLLTLYVLFVGLAGFLAYVAQGAIDRGMTFGDTTLAIAAMKILAGIWLIVANLRLGANLRQRFLAIGVILAISVALAADTRDPIVFFLSLLSIEITFNTLSARFQAKFAEANRAFAGQWLTGTILLGAACGPPLLGAAIGADLTIFFVLLATGSALLPAIWARAYTAD